MFWAFIILLGLIIPNGNGKTQGKGAEKGLGKQVDDRWMNFEDLFLYGKDAYLSNDWKMCIYYMEKAVEDYRFYNDQVIRCKMECRRDADWSPAPSAESETSSSVALLVGEDADEDVRFFEKAVRNTLCLMKCKRLLFGKDRAEQTAAETIKEFESKSPYNYLQLCYHQVKSNQSTNNKQEIPTRIITIGAN